MPPTSDIRPLTSGAALLVPLVDLHRCPLNPRERFEGLDGLAVSLRGPLGCVLPLLVRARAEGGFEVVDGERRRLAGQERVVDREGDAGKSGERASERVRLGALHAMPVQVVEMSDAEVLELMLTTGIQREDLSPMEEAVGLERWMAADGLSQEAAARRLGVSQQWVSQRLSLLRLPERGRAALLDGRISFEVGRELAGCPLGMLPEVVECVVEPGKFPIWREPGAMRVEDVQRLREHFSRSLKGVAWKLEDADLVPVKAGVDGKRLEGGACVGCEWRGDEAVSAKGGRKRGAGVCLNPSCFDKKVAVAAASALAKVVSSGAVELKGEERREALHGGANGAIGFEFVDLDAELEEGKRWEDVVRGEEGPVVRVLAAVDDQGKVRRLARREEAVEAARMLGRGAEVGLSRGGGASVQEKEIRTREKEQEARVAGERKVRAKVAGAVLEEVDQGVRDAVRNNNQGIWPALVDVALRHAGKAGAVYACRRRNLDPGEDPQKALREYAEEVEASGPSFVSSLVVELLLALDFCGAENPNVGAVVAPCAERLVKWLEVDVKRIEKAVREGSRKDAKTQSKAEGEVGV